VRTKHVHFELVDYLENGLDEAARRRISGHLNSCERCREDMETLASALSRLKELPADSLPRSYFTGFLPRVRQRLDQKAEKKQVWTPRVIYVAAPVLSLMVLIFLLLKVPVFERQSLQSDALRPMIVSLSPDEIAEVMGSRLHGEVMNEAENPSVYNTVIKKQYNAVNVVKDALKDKSASLVLNENDYQGMIESLNDEQVDHIIVRLKEREVL
jgi:hypothetical protein